MNVVGSDIQVNVTVAKVSPRRRPPAGRAAGSRRRTVEVEFGDLPLDLVARPDRWDQDLLSGIEAVGGSDTEAGARLDEMRRFFAFVRGEVPQADGQVARAPYRVDLTLSG
jgi:hypothetical protein